MRGPLLAVAGAAVAAVVAAAAALGFLSWRASEQARAFEADRASCRQGKHQACDKLRTACDKRSAHACETLADLYLSGDGVIRSEAEALRFLRDACEHRSAQGCLRAAALQEKQASTVSEATAAALRERACSLGAKQACAYSERPE
jgi:TPR repeat protein